ncbi:phage tail tube protein [Microbacterium maritypicum]
MLKLPAAVPSMGTRRVVFASAVANIEAITVAEVTAGENVSCYLTRANGWAPTGDQAVINDSRYCSAQDFELPGTKSRQLSVQYTFNLDEPTEDEARLALTEGTPGYFIHFLQKDDGDATFAADDWYEAVPVLMGMQNVVQVEDNAVDRIMQRAFITGEWVSFKQLVAP